MAGKFTERSDVFAFGVVIWEIYSYGELPYAELSNVEVADAMMTGSLPRLMFPPNCSPETVRLAQRCLQPAPESRPRFAEVVSSLSEQNQAQLSRGTAPATSGPVAATLAATSAEPVPPPRTLPRGATMSTPGKGEGGGPLGSSVWLWSQGYLLETLFGSAGVFCD
jgi:serine/threonine protein kinase